MPLEKWDGEGEQRGTRPWRSSVSAFQGGRAECFRWRVTSCRDLAKRGHPEQGPSGSRRGGHKNGRSICLPLLE